MESKQAEAAARVQSAHAEMEKKGGGVTQPKRKQAYDRTSRSWQFSFKTPYGEDRTFEFTLSVDPYMTSIALLAKKYRRPLIMVSGCIIREDGTKGEILFNSKVEVPNFWPDRDPHTMFSETDAKIIVHSAIRDINEEIVRRHVGDWLMSEITRSGAIHFDLDIK